MVSVTTPAAGGGGAGAGFPPEGGGVVPPLLLPPVLTPHAVMTNARANIAGIAAQPSREPWFRKAEPVE